MALQVTQWVSDDGGATGVTLPGRVCARPPILTGRAVPTVLRLQKLWVPSALDCPGPGPSAKGYGPPERAHKGTVSAATPEAHKFVP